MEKLSKLLKDNKIDLSLAVYPWPGTLKYDSENNKQVEIWQNFCILHLFISSSFSRRDI